MTEYKLVSQIKDEGEHRAYMGTPSELADFCYDLRRNLRGCMTTIRDRRSVWVYMPDDVFAMGWVGYGEFRDRAKTDVDAFVVCSNHIANEKYSSHSTQYHMKMTVNRDVAMRNAKKFLRRPTPVEVAEYFKKSMKGGASSVEGEARHAFNEVKRDLFDTNYRTVLPPIAAELKILLDSGYEFVDKTIGDNIRKLFEKAEEFQDKAQKINAYCVVLQERLGRTIFEVVTVDDVANYTCTIHEDVQRYHEEQVPEDIAGKLAVLSMCEVDQYVPDVGVRANEKVFYVAR